MIVLDIYSKSLAPFRLFVTIFKVKGMESLNFKVVVLHEANGFFIFLLFFYAIVAFQQLCLWWNYSDLKYILGVSTIHVFENDRNWVAVFSRHEIVNVFMYLDRGASKMSNFWAIILVVLIISNLLKMANALNIFQKLIFDCFFLMLNVVGYKLH